MEFNIQSVNITEKLFNEILTIREMVFIQEQNVPKSLEALGDENAIHFLLSARMPSQKKFIPVSTGRYVKLSGIIKIERVATLKEYRGFGFGKELMQYMLQNSFQKEPNIIPLLYSQQSALEFYINQGWQAYGKKFTEANICHRKMVYLKGRDLAKNDLIKKYLKIAKSFEIDSELNEFLKSL